MIVLFGEHTPLSSSKCHLRERQVSAGVASQDPIGRLHFYDCFLRAHQILLLSVGFEMVANHEFGNVA